MMTAMEDNPHEGWLISLTKAYVESNLTWQQLCEAIAAKQGGQRLTEIVRKLFPDAQVSPELDWLTERSFWLTSNR